MKLNATAFGLACGVVMGLASFAATLLSLWRGAGYTITTIAGAYFGYSWSIIGAFIGLFWGLVYGFVFGWVLATVYNRVSG